MQLPHVLSETHSTVLFRPMLLGGVFKGSGNAAPVGVKASYNRQDIERSARRLSIPLVMNPFFPINTLLMMRAATVAHEEELQSTYLAAVYRGMWVDGLNMGDKDVLLGVLKSAGLNGPHILARTEEPHIKQRLKDTTEEAVARGVFGAPTFFVGDEMFWGQDRIDQVIEAAKA
jgi:2-hydroxychromene-2-carboxylate isomerase